MAYYRKKYYNNWRSRSWNSSPPSRYSVLFKMFGSAVNEMRIAFMNLEKEALDEIFSDYGAIHGATAESYARKTFPKWKNGATSLSGQTMERLIELIPPYLSSEQRFAILQGLIKFHKKPKPQALIKINIKEPDEGIAALKLALESMKQSDLLAHLPEGVMKAATWLYDNDVTSLRSILAEADRMENDMIRASASREIELLIKTIKSGQIQTANYSVKMPSGSLDVIAFTPSKCFISTVCFGEYAAETEKLRSWRDEYLTKKLWGRRFIVWYYSNGENIANVTQKSKFLLTIFKFGIKIFIWSISNKFNRGMK